MIVNAAEEVPNACFANATILSKSASAGVSTIFRASTARCRSDSLGDRTESSPEGAIVPRLGASLGAIVAAKSSAAIR